MEWSVLGFIAAMLMALSILFWRKWVAPWRDVDEIVAALASGRAPRKFLLSANPHAQSVGLALEKLSASRRELEMRANENEFSAQTILAAMPDGLLIVDERRRAVLASPQLHRFFGNENAAGVALLEIVREANVDRMVSECIRTGEQKQTAMRAANGQADLHLEVSASPRRDQAGRVDGAIVLFRDVTRLRETEEMRRDFVANVSHELRTPLSIFRGYLETLLDNPKQPPSELVRILEVMERHSDRLNSLVEDVLSLARLEAGADLVITQISLPDFLRAIVRDWEKRFAEKNLRATVDLAENLPELPADENRLQEIIYNLLDNAVKYSPAGGAISLRVSRSDARVRIEISDEGSGIAARDLPRIFDRFYRGDKARSRELGGTGLGLSIVKHIAQLHGGSVEARSEPGRGATIAVILPLTPDANAAGVTET